MCKRLIRLSKPLAALLLLTVLPAGCSTNPATGRRQLILISRQQEIAIGSEAAPKFEKEFGGRVPNERLQAYIRMVGRKVAAVSDRSMPYEFVLVNSKTPNAFALPGGKIFLTAGLMSRMANERELAAVLGHETGHVAAQHNVIGMQRQVGVAILIEVAGAIAGQESAGSAKAVTKVVAGMAALRYTRKDEYEADKFGLLYMVRAGYNPWGMVELLTVLHNLSKSQPGLLDEMFQTHPATSKRIAEVTEMIEDNRRYRKYSSKAPDPNARRFRRMHALLLATMRKTAKK